MGRPGGLAFEADLLVVAGRGAHIAERKTVFDQRGPAASMAGMDRDGVLAYGTLERLRVHALASSDHASPTWRGFHA